MIVLSHTAMSAAPACSVLPVPSVVGYTAPDQSHVHPQRPSEVLGSECGPLVQYTAVGFAVEGDAAASVAWRAIAVEVWNLAGREAPLRARSRPETAPVRCVSVLGTAEVGLA